MYTEYHDNYDISVKLLQLVKIFLTTRFPNTYPAHVSSCVWPRRALRLSRLGASNLPKKDWVRALARLGGISTNLNAFLDLIGYSEGTTCIPGSDDGYNVLVGSSTKRPFLFDSYKDHPRQKIQLSPTLASTAAGKYQVLARIFDAYKLSLCLHDFSPESQDKIAIQLIKECHAIGDIESGNIEEAIKKCSSRWASFPGPGNQYGQHVNEISTLLAVYRTLIKESE